MLSHLAEQRATESCPEAAVAALVEAAGGDAEALHDAREPFLLRLHADATDIDATRALSAIERAGRVLHRRQSTA